MVIQMCGRPWIFYHLFMFLYELISLCIIMIINRCKLLCNLFLVCIQILTQCIQAAIEVTQLQIHKA